MILNYLIISSAIIILATIFLGIYLLFARRRVGILQGNIEYADYNQGKVLYSQKLLLMGKPDYIINTSDGLIPVEIKTSKTPSIPYKSHIMQIAAYCALVDENYNQRPRFGIIKYPDKEFKIEYSNDLFEKLKVIVSEIINYKTGIISAHNIKKSKYCIN